MSKVKCPFVYANGEHCTGHVISVEAFKADLEWTPDSDGRWKLSVNLPRTHFHLYCSEKNNHAGAYGPDRLKFWFDDLPAELRESLQWS